MPRFCSFELQVYGGCRESDFRADLQQHILLDLVEVFADRGFGETQHLTPKWLELAIGVSWLSIFG